MFPRLILVPLLLFTLRTSASAEPLAGPAEEPAAQATQPATQRPAPTLLKGRVVLKSDPSRGVADVKVVGHGTTASGSWFEATSGADGRFETRWGAAPVIVQAKTADGDLSGIVPVQPDGTDITIPLEPLTSARGRLIDRESGVPLPDRTVDFGVRIDRKDGILHLFGSSAKTDAHGEFTLTGLAPGATFDIRAVIDNHPDGRRRYLMVAKVTPKPTETAQLGDVKLFQP